MVDNYRIVYQLAAGDQVNILTVHYGKRLISNTRQEEVVYRGKPLSVMDNHIYRPQVEKRGFKRFDEALLPVNPQFVVYPLAQCAGSMPMDEADFTLVLLNGLVECSAHARYA